MRKARKARCVMLAMVFSVVLGFILFSIMSGVIRSVISIVFLLCEKGCDNGNG